MIANQSLNTSAMNGSDIGENRYAEGRGVTKAADIVVVQDGPDAMEAAMP